VKNYKDVATHRYSTREWRILKRKTERQNGREKEIRCNAQAFS
jgi:hypothetical protein